MLYLCTLYGTELDMGSLFHRRFCHRTGETGILGRL